MSIRQKKSLSQVFLKEVWPLHKMAEFICQNGVEHVLEIGPGGGVLTKVLLERGLKVTALEADKRFVEQLQKTLASSYSTLEVIHTDVLKYDLASWAQTDQSLKMVVGNIPYHISSPIMEWFFKAGDICLGAMFLTQLEFARRVCAVPGNKDYGSLSVFAQLRSQPSYMFEVGRDCFKPIPKVDSAVFSLMRPAVQYDDELLERVETLCRQAFSQRRKVLSNSLKSYLDTADLQEVPVDLKLRPERLTPKDFVNLANFFHSENSSPSSGE